MSVNPIGGPQNRYPARIDEALPRTTGSHCQVRRNDQFEAERPGGPELTGTGARSQADLANKMIETALKLVEAALNLLKSFLGKGAGAQQPPAGGGGTDPTNQNTGVVPPTGGTKPPPTPMPPTVAPPTTPPTVAPPTTPPTIAPPTTANQVNSPQDLADRNGFRWIDQNNPAGADQSYTNGRLNCGPAVMAMVARSLGMGNDLSDAQLIDKLGKIGLTNDQTGTSLNGIIGMADALGDKVKKDDVKYPGFDQGWMDKELADGKAVVANGALEDKKGVFGHYILVTGKDEKGDYKVNDPWDAHHNRMTGQELKAFLEKNPVHHGASVAIDGHKHKD